MVMDWSYVGAVVISGLAIVFVALILLILAVWIMGQFFTAIKGERKPKSETKNAAASPAADTVKSSPEPAAAISAALPVVPDSGASEASDADDEVIAVIAAAVAAMSAESGQPLKIKSIRPARGRVRSNAWAGAAAAESTRSF